MVADILVGDARRTEVAHAVRAQLANLAKTQADCVILHPPYHDIISFGDDPANLCNQPSVDAFLREFALVVDRAVELLAPGRFLALVAGDIYVAAEWVPLGFSCMEFAANAA